MRSSIGDTDQADSSQVLLVKDEKVDVTSKNTKRIYDFEQVLDIVGSDGFYQKLLIYGFICPYSILMPILELCTVFLLSEPDHWCHVSGNETGTYTLAHWKERVLPKVIGADGHERYSQCFMYDEKSNETGDKRQMIPCNNGWEYDTTDYKRTIPTANNWVCSKSHYAAQAFTIASAGNAFGAICFGYIGDRYGRKIVLVVGTIINLIARTWSFYTTETFWLFLLTHFIVSTCYPMVGIIAVTSIIEICNKDCISWILGLSTICWVLGLAVMPYIAWIVGDWYTFGLLTTAPLIIVCFYFKNVPESPRWYLSVGRIREAELVLKDIARVNVRLGNIKDGEIRRMLIELKERQDEDGDKNQNSLRIFTKERLAVRTVLLSIVWSMNVLVYYGITLNTTNNMAGNQFINFFILSIVELPTGWIGGYLVEKTGRRWTQAFFFVFCMGGFLAAGIGVRVESCFIVTISLMVSKFSIGITSLIVTLQAMEMFPTELRSTGSGIASTVGSIVGISAPIIIVELGKIHILIPYLIMALISLIGTISSTLLPETAGQTLPETLEDANNLGNNAKFWSFLPRDYKTKRRSSSFAIIGDYY